MDAVLIPGGGVTSEGQVPPWVAVRLDRAIALTPSPRYFIPLSAGTTHKPPPLDDRGFPVLEAIAGGRYLGERGIAPTRILPEALSLDSIGNAYFARILHTDPLRLRRLHVITSDFHLPRIQAIFDWVFHLDSPPDSYHLSFESVPDVGLTATALAGRYAKERKGLVRVQSLQNQIRSLPELHHWLYTEHQAYAIAGNPLPIKTAALESY